MLYGSPHEAGNRHTDAKHSALSGSTPRSQSRETLALRDLGRHPLRWPEGEHPGVRERQVEGYRILYRVAAAPDDGGVIAGGVLVARVFGLGQNRRGL